MATIPSTPNFDVFLATWRFRRLANQSVFQFFPSILATVDINLAQFQYLADHLTSIECRKLVASLHFDSFELPGALDKAERSVSKDVRCLESLLHWNSEAGGGRSETHELVARRLRQLDRDDLGEWLTKTSYEAIGHDFDRESKEAFKPYQPIVLPELKLNGTTAGIRRNATGSGGTTLAIDRFAHRRIAKQDFVPTIATDIATDPTEWTIFDTISWTLVVMMFLFIIGVMVYLTITSPCCKHHGWNNLFSKNQRYKRYECLQCEEDDYYDRTTRRSTDTRSTPVCPRTGGTCPMHSRPKRSQQQSYGRRQSSQNDPTNNYANQISPYHQQICPPCKKKSTQTDNKPFNQLSSYQQIPPCPPCQHHAKRQNTESRSSDDGAAITPMPVEMSESSDTEYEEACCPNICPAMQLMGCDMPNKHIPLPPPGIKPENNNNSTLNNNNVDKKCTPCPIVRSPKSDAYSAAMRTIDIHQKIAIPMGPVPS
ncbi:PREDICTED: uncharacterized protein LOC108565718 [Nicrophorus vespilloides]|uniref:Uncharacterized protein LOC108565718 n=1 Tax=Nicrophorus vespilloides TaxID=110193 RepID=A0ABM1N1U5_NICVS|nr:PREDICTED: uncharacterized protein LOC108565718 [Nicrophorus vespilloides]